MATDHNDLTFTEADAGIAPWVIGFVHRHDTRCGRVVFELPELRASIQLMLADDYWLNEGKGWRRVPRIALWGPRARWGFGYAKREVHAFAVGLTQRGLEALTGRPGGDFAEKIIDLSALAPTIARALQSIVRRGGAADWRRATSDRLARYFSGCSSALDALDLSRPLLLAENATIASAAEAAGMTERHYRRCFRARYGFAPRTYRRVARIDRLLRRLHPAPWERDAGQAEPDFADQPHMIREFKALTGVTPGEYVRSKRAYRDATLRSVVAEGIAPPVF